MRIDGTPSPHRTAFFNIFQDVLGVPDPFLGSPISQVFGGPSPEELAERGQGGGAGGQGGNAGGGITEYQQAQLQMEARRDERAAEQQEMIMMLGIAVVGILGVFLVLQAT